MATDVLASTGLFSFGLVTFLAGLFTAYFGAGKSRGIGGGLLVVGLLAGVAFAWFTSLISIGVAAPVQWSAGKAVTGLFALVGGVIGAGVAGLLFLASIMKA